MSGFPTIKSHMTVICQDNGEQTTGIIRIQKCPAVQSNN